MKKIVIYLIAFLFLLPIFWGKVQAESKQTIFINKKYNKMIFYENGKKVKEFNVATGREPSLTPEGTYTLTVKWKNPIYYRLHISGGDPRNPLGDRWMGFNARGTNGYTYGIHGTNVESSIGTYASSGCIRMHKVDSRWLFDRVKTGAKIIIVHSNKRELFENHKEKAKIKVAKSVKHKDNKITEVKKEVVEKKPEPVKKELSPIAKNIFNYIIMYLKN
jgi:hypothetical protein